MTSILTNTNTAAVPCSTHAAQRAREKETRHWKENGKWKCLQTTGKAHRRRRQNRSATATGWQKQRTYTSSVASGKQVKPPMQIDTQEFCWAANSVEITAMVISEFTQRDFERNRMAQGDECGTKSLGTSRKRMTALMVMLQPKPAVCWFHWQLRYEHGA